jgi:hypothetical protein
VVENLEQRSGIAARPTIARTPISLDRVPNGPFGSGWQLSKIEVFVVPFAQHHASLADLSCPIG